MATGNSKSNYAEALVLNALLKGSGFTAPSSHYLALYTTAPTDSGGGTEVSTSGTAYARQSIALGSVATQSPSGSQVSNSSDISFPVATANYGTVVAFGIFDASTSGNLLYYGNLTSSQTINTGNQALFPAGSITILED